MSDDSCDVCVRWGWWSNHPSACWRKSRENRTMLISPFRPCMCVHNDVDAVTLKMNCTTTYRHVYIHPTSNRKLCGNFERGYLWCPMKANCRTNDNAEWRQVMHSHIRTHAHTHTNKRGNVIVRETDDVSVYSGMTGLTRCLAGVWREWDGFRTQTIKSSALRYACNCCSTSVGWQFRSDENTAESRSSNCRSRAASHVCVGAWIAKQTGMLIHMYVDLCACVCAVITRIPQHSRLSIMEHVCMSGCAREGGGCHKEEI